MERIVLFLVLGAFLTGSMYAYNIQRNATDADAALWSYQYQELARDAALAGLDRTVAALARDAHAPWPSPSTYSLSSTAHGTGFYEVSVQSVGGSTDTLDVYVTGINGPDTMRIDARYRRAPDDHETPPPFRTVLLADDLTLDGDDIVVRSNAPNRNASIHVNETLDLDQFDLDVHGYGTFTTPGSDEFDVADFLPNIDYNGAEPNVLQIPEIPVPDAHMDSAFASLFRTGDFVLEPPSGSSLGVYSSQSEVAASCASGDLLPAACQTGPDGLYVLGNTVPLVWYVDGNIAIRNVQISGNIVMYARGNDGVSGNAAITLEGVVQGDSTGGTGHLLLRSREPIRIHKDGAIRASVWTNSTIRVDDVPGAAAPPTPGFSGTLLGRGIEFDLNSADDYDLTYLPPSPLITAPGYSSDDPIGPKLMAYAEWDDVVLP